MFNKIVTLFPAKIKEVFLLYQYPEGEFKLQSALFGSFLKTLCALALSPMHSKSEKNNFLVFFSILTTDIEAKLNDLESESDPFP